MIKVNVGCGNWNFGEGWVHVDIEKHSHVTSENHSLVDFEENYFDEIYSSHFLGYFSRDTAFEILKRWHRALKDGGELKIAVPDYFKLNELYVNGKIPIEDTIGPVHGRMSSNQRPITHQTSYDIRSLSKLLHKAGFDHIEQVEQGFYHTHRDQSWAYLPDRMYYTGTLISLNLTATK